MGLNIGMIRESFERVKPISERIADRFYTILWTDYPLSKVMFEGVDMAKQKNALIQGLGQIVDYLDSPPRLIDYLQAMGGRHHYYGAEEHHYEWVGESLLKAFGELLGDAWTPPLVEQWNMVLQFISDYMKKGALAAQEKEQEKNKTPAPKPVLVKLPEDAPKPTQSSPDRLTIELPTELRQKLHEAVQKAVDECVENEIRGALGEIEKRLETQGITGFLQKKIS
jgi:hemoglobin-like flavoprotein